MQNTCFDDAWVIDQQCFSENNLNPSEKHWSEDDESGVDIVEKKCFQAHIVANCYKLKVFAIQHFL